MGAVLAICKALPIIAELVEAIIAAVGKQNAAAQTAANASALNSNLAAIAAFVKSAQTNAGPLPR